MGYNENDVYTTTMAYAGVNEARAAEKAVRDFIAAIQAEASALSAADVALNANAAQMQTMATVAQASHTRISSAFGTSAYKMQLFAQGLDDLQYVGEQGLRPIINNLVQMSPLLGVAAIGVQLLISHWDQLATLFGQGHTKTESERMEELGKKTHKTAEETKQLKEYKEAIAELEKLNTLKADEEKERGAKIQEAIANEGGPGLAQRGVAQGLYGEAAARHEDLFNQMADFRAKQARGEPVTGADVDQYNQMVKDARDLKARLNQGAAGFNDMATAMLNRAGAGDRGAGDRIRGFMGARPEDFGPGMIQGFDAASPERMELERRGERQAKEIEVRRKQAEEQRRKDREDNEDAMEKAIGVGEERERREVERKQRAAQVEAQNKAADDRERKQRDAQQAADMQALTAGGFDEQAQLAIMQNREQGRRMNPRQRAAAEERLRQQINRGAYQNLVGQGVEPGRAEMLAGQAPGLLAKDLDQKLAGAAAQMPGHMGRVQRGQMAQAVISEQLTMGLAAVVNQAAQVEAKQRRVMGNLQQLNAQQRMNTMPNFRQTPAH